MRLADDEILNEAKFVLLLRRFQRTVSSNHGNVYWIIKNEFETFDIFFFFFVFSIARYL